MVTSYESGWSVVQTDENGEVSSPKIYKSHGGFISFYAKEGENHYYVSYQTPYLKEGIQIMAAGLLCVGCYSMLGFILFTNKRKYKDIELKLNWMFFN